MPPGIAPQTVEEEQILEQTLRRCLSDLDLEILHTDHAEFRRMLEQRPEVLKRIHDPVVGGAGLGLAVCQERLLPAGTSGAPQEGIDSRIDPAALSA